jgi:site-specific DNA-methyltransferase (adenine-specific)
LLKAMPDASFDSCVTDPPYELKFMGRKWDSTGIAYSVELWREVLRVLKPGARLLAFGGTRTYHRMTCAIEDAGFVIEDCIMWVYGQGFPKHGSKLKPAYEPIVVARKGGVTNLNIDACRIPGAVPTCTQGQSRNAGAIYGADQRNLREFKPNDGGRWPANVILDEEAAAVLDEQSGTLSSGFMSAEQERKASHGKGGYHGGFVQPPSPNGTYGDSGGASRFFYCAKASRKEREAGLDELPLKDHGMSGGAQGALDRGEDAYQQESIGLNRIVKVRNTHPTVKPLALMRYLVRLVTPPGGRVLDHFAGSYTTLVACAYEGFDGVGIDREAGHVNIGRAKLKHALRNVRVGELYDDEEAIPVL